jgi:hypothetical protein
MVWRSLLFLVFTAQQAFAIYLIAANLYVACEKACFYHYFCNY